MPLFIFFFPTFLVFILFAMLLLIIYLLLRLGLFMYSLVWSKLCFFTANNAKFYNSSLSLILSFDIFSEQLLLG